VGDKRLNSYIETDARRQNDKHRKLKTKLYQFLFQWLWHSVLNDMLPMSSELPDLFLLHCFMDGRRDCEISQIIEHAVQID